MWKKSCFECSRRQALGGISAAALVALLPSCTQSGSSLPTAKQTTCGSGACIDLADPSNQPLAKLGGAMLVDMGSDTVMVIRSTETIVVAVSAICTHAGCTMDFVPGSELIRCPCHGSQFGEDGSVLQGPARIPLQVYTATIENGVITIAT